MIPPWVNVEPGLYSDDHNLHEPARLWIRAMLDAEDNYISLMEYFKWTPQQARAVLPNSLKTEIVVTANFREWRHIFKLRCAKTAHPQMREIMIPLLAECKELIPVVFDDIKGDKE